MTYKHQGQYNPNKFNSGKNVQYTFESYLDSKQKRTQLVAENVSLKSFNPDAAE